MQQKKNPKKDIRRWSLIFFQVGLIIVLFISWRAIESKNYEHKSNEEPVEINYNDLEPEDVEVVDHPETNTPPPPKPPKVPDKIKIVEDDEDIEEDEPETVEDVEEEKVEVADISDVQSAPAEDEGDEEIEEVPFKAIQDVPIFPGCEQYSSNEKRKQCMEEKVQKFVNKRFNTDIGRDLGLSGLTRINVQFTVDEHGDVTDVKARATEAPLEDEAKRVVNMLPDMQPGKQRDKPVRVIYQLPIVFKVN